MSDGPPEQKPSKPRVTRRQALAATGAATLAVPYAISSLDPEHPAPTARAVEAGSGSTMTTNERMPVVFVPHGGGPWPFVDIGVPQPEVDALAGYLRELRDLPRTKPKALLVISAHWEAPVPTVMTSEHPPILYDYYNFPPESYRITWPAPGDPALARRVRELLGSAGFPSAEDDRRGYDHGTFIPLKVTYPEADIPTVQLSLIESLDPESHLRLGRTLAARRDEGVLIIGSGMTFHNLRAFRDPRALEISEAFDAWLQEAVTATPNERNARLSKWSEAPLARVVHPREEHLIPLLVAAGAAGEDRGATTWAGTFMAPKISGYHFG